MTLQIDDLTMRFGGINALQGLSLDLPDDDLIGVIGPNGAGKSTLLNVVTGTFRPTEGRIRYEGEDITGWSTRRLARRGIVRSWQAGRLFESLTVEDNVLVGAHVIRSTRRARAVVAEALERFDLGHAAKRVVTELSLPERRRVVLARLMVTRPRLMMLDEPFAGLEHEEKVDFARTVADLARTAGVRVVLIEHDVRLVVSLSTHLVVLSTGRLLASGRPEEVIADEQVKKEYLGYLDLEYVDD
jgi:branched-chain amino acid transport system ATP-binding protein